VKYGIVHYRDTIAFPRERERERESCDKAEGSCSCACTADLALNELCAVLPWQGSIGRCRADSMHYSQRLFGVATIWTEEFDALS
jgi:hypothetical protein